MGLKETWGGWLNRFKRPEPDYVEEKRENAYKISLVVSDTNDNVEQFLLDTDIRIYNYGITRVYAYSSDLPGQVLPLLSAFYSQKSGFGLPICIKAEVHGTYSPDNLRNTEWVIAATLEDNQIRKNTQSFKYELNQDDIGNLIYFSDLIEKESTIAFDEPEATYPNPTPGDMVI